MDNRKWPQSESASRTHSSHLPNPCMQLQMVGMGQDFKHWMSMNMMPGKAPSHLGPGMPPLQSDHGSWHPSAHQHLGASMPRVDKQCNEVPKLEHHQLLGAPNWQGSHQIMDPKPNPCVLPGDMMPVQLFHHDGMGKDHIRAPFPLKANPFASAALPAPPMKAESAGGASNGTPTSTAGGGSNPPPGGARGHGATTSGSGAAGGTSGAPKTKKSRKGKNKNKELKGPFTCTLCGSVYDLAHNFNIHVLSHKDDDVFNSSASPPKSKKSKKHSNKPPPEKRFQCEYCDSKFAWMDKLKQHTRIHTGEKPYECEFCQSKFARLDKLKVHRRIHTGEKPYECKICFKAFARSEKLKRHSKTHLVNPAI